ncbi:Heavy-metal-associated domain-containing protein [Aspergillus sp. HF37]|nr:Heavy-metal-associated domain-containing protein [Aspergillus sp. HF37]
MTDHQLKLNVKTGCSSCSGCSGCSMAIKEALEPLSGVRSLDIILEIQSVLVAAEPLLSLDTIVAAVREKGEAINSADVDGVRQSV